ncbi:hypothetical protein ACL02U_02255 [Streptomyces sp. MS06]|uniref:hypothetical protein n=1 Tax=Streptomyces sp. MS06 TaxID=3385974 RepID=UPI00399F9C60
MTSGLIIAVIVIAVAVAAALAAPTVRNRGRHGGRGLKKRFGPEYDRAVARHGGDVEAAERELGERVRRYGDLHRAPLGPAARERYAARWTAAQERFVDAPQEAVAEADRLIAEVSEARGFPGGEDHEDRLAALSVHHAEHVHGYRTVHRLARGDAARQEGSPGTEQLREAVIEGRALFEDLTREERQAGPHRASAEAGAATPDRGEAEQAERTKPAALADRLPWALTRRHAKGS